MEQPVKPVIVHVITELGSGGAERVLARLVIASTEFHHIVVSLTDESGLAADLRGNGVEVITLGMRRSLPSPRALLRLAQIIRHAQPAAVQTWLYHADLIGLIATRLAGCGKVAWNLRCSDMDLARYRWLTRLVLRLLVRLSTKPELILANSEAGRAWHAALGYRPRRWEIVPNGIDTGVFRPDSTARQRWRQRLGVADNAVLIGMVARRDPMKDHETMVAAAALAAHRSAALAFVFAGHGVTRNDPVLAHLADAVGAPVNLIDECNDVPGLMAALDVAVLSSAFGEGFPNVVAEAMATGVPCVVTDVGDAASIVGETGHVVPPRSPEALAQAILTLVSDAPLRARLGAAARRRVLESFNLATAVARYEALWASLIAAEPLRPSPTAIRSAD